MMINKYVMFMFGQVRCAEMDVVIDKSETNCVLGKDSALKGYIGLGTSWANGINFVFTMPPVQDRSFDLLTSILRATNVLLIRQHPPPSLDKAYG